MSSTTKYKVMIDSYQVKNKAHINPAKIKVNIMNKPARALPLHTIAKRLEAGHTVILSELGITDDLKAFMAKKERKYPTARKEAWISQQLFGVDIDNEYTVLDPLNKVNQTIKFTGDFYLEKSQILQLCKTKNLRPCLIYESLSSKKGHRKYRVIFALDRPITTLKEQEQIAAAFVQLFSIHDTVVADKHCTDPARLFYAARNVVFKDYESVNDSEYLLNVPVTYKNLQYQSTTVLSTPPRKAASKKVARETINQLVGLSLSDHYQEPNQTVDLIKNKEWLRLKNVLISNAESFMSLTAPRDAEDKRTDKIIANDYFKYVRELLCSSVLGLSPYVPIDRKDFHVRISTIPLDILLGLPHNEPFSCILPGHEDKNPSARIFNSMEKSRYYCSGCCSEHALDIFDLMNIYLPDLSKTEIRRRISTLFNITESTKWQREQRLLLQENANYLFEPDNAGIGSLKEDSLYLYKKLSRSSWLNFLYELYTQASIHVHDRCITKDEKPNYIAELRRIGQIMRSKYGRGYSDSALQKNLHLSALLGFIEYVPDDADNPLVQIGIKRKNEANELRIAENEKKRAKNKKTDYLLQYRANVIRLNLINSPKILLEAERRHKILTDSKFPFGKAHEREVYKWGTEILGISIDDHFVQDKEKNIKDPLHVALFKKFRSAMRSLDKKGVRYFTYDELLSHRIIKEFKFEGSSIPRKDKKTVLTTVTPELLQVQETFKITNYSSYYRELYQISKEEERKKKLKPNTNFFALNEDIKKKSIK